LELERAPLRVLIVEDSEDDALLLLRELRRGGYEPEYDRVDTPEAMEKALADPGSWDVIFSDYHMPRFGAPEALKMWRASGSEAPFIVVSGKVGEDVAARTIKAGAYDYVMKDNLTRLRAVVERSLHEAREKRDLRRAGRELQRRDAILEAVRFAAERFLSEVIGWEQSIKAVLKQLGEATGASRVYVFENFVGGEGELWGSQRYEWVATGLSTQIDDSLVQAIPYNTAGYGRWAELLGRGEPVYGYTREFPQSEQPKLREQGILSILLVPIFVEGKWWGQIGFDDCSEEREWSAAEVGALGAAAGTLGAAIRRRRIEEELRQSEGRYRAVVEQATDGIYLLDAATRRILESNPSYQKMLGYTADELRGMEVYDFVAHPRENVDSTIERTLREKRRVVGGRKYRRKDGSLVDVEVGVSVISYDGREVICTIVRDVTERKQAEEELREAEERFRSAFGDAAIGMALVGTDGRWLQVNRSLCRLVGYSEEELLAKTFQDITHPDDLEADLNYVRRMLAGEIQTYQMEKRYLHRDGRVVWISLNVSLVRDAEGEPLYFIAQMQDVTERKQAEEDLIRSENRLRTIIETEPECVKVLGMDGALLEMNPAGLSMIEADSLEQVRGKPVYDYIGAGHRTAFVAFTESVLRGGSGTLEFEFVGLKGTRRWLDTNAVPLRDARGGIAGLLAITRDITERKQNEEALRQSERLYRAVIEQATENIFLIDVETRRIVESNPVFQETLGYTEEELERMTLYDIIAADRESIDRNLQRTLERRRAFVGERKYRRKDGSLVDVEVSASIVLRDGRETLCAVAHDVTERVRAQELLEERVATLSRIATDFALDLPIQTTLDALAKSVVRASTALSCSVSLVDEKSGHLRIEGSYGLPEGFEEGIEAVWRSGVVSSPSLEAVRTRQPMLAKHMRQRMSENPLYAPVHSSVREAEWDTVFIVPLVSRGRVLGTLNFGYLEGEQPSEDERVFLGAVADKTEVSLENARLFTEARGKAALEERQRLARELHDSVSQALYGIALGAKTARTLLDQDPERATDPLEYVLSLAEAGMAEMRALIFELRPESLETEGLAVALEKQAAALRARHEIEVEACVCDEPEASLGAKEAVYRIAQEALHNVVKHASANRVEIKMECHPEQITLDVSDDGVGFDARKDFPGHLGLHSMRERASRLGGTLRVQTASGRGTRIWARIPL
jgi:PAS domain S-box-containing protein